MSNAQLTILLVEDNPADARLIQRFFAQRHGAGVRVEHAETLASALTLLSQDGGAFDVILLDLTLPDSESLGTLRAVEAHAPEMPVVVLSGLADEELALQAVREGAQDYLVKGHIDAELLTRSVRYAVERQRVEKDRDAARRALTASESRFQSFMDNSPAVAFMKDESGRYVYVNALYERLFHIRLDQLGGKTDRDVFAADVAARLREADTRVLEAGTAMEFTEEVPLDGELREWLTIKFPVWDEGKRLIAGIALDVTERRRAERALREADEQLKQAQKMEAEWQLASGVAHDFNNLLTAIRGYASLARHTLHEDHPALESLDQVEEAARQATGVAGALLTFARVSRSAKAPVPVAAAVESAVRLFRRMLPPAVRLSLDLSRGEGVWVEADDTQLQQVVINLALNARDAIGAGEGTISVWVAPAKALRKGGGPRPAGVCIHVKDTGSGMSREVEARIFEPFFTTKPRGRGTGLGLSVIHGIVHDHGGSISVETGPGRGSTFTVWLPVVPAPSGAAEKAPPEHSVIAGGSALLAEDNQLVRALLATMLSALGYEVVNAGTAEQALGAATREGQKLDLIVIDQNLPGGPGLELVGQLRQRGLATRAVVVTAASGTDQPLPQGTVLLRKPFQLADLRQAIAELYAPIGAETPA
jgi:two-component system cell cycle sensor histidine kinase/response regulator CckA